MEVGAERQGREDLCCPWYVAFDGSSWLCLRTCRAPVPSELTRSGTRPAGNGGTTFGTKTTSVNVKGDDFPALQSFAVENKVSRRFARCMWRATCADGTRLPIYPQINLVVIGPEQPLVDGLEGFFRAGKSSASELRSGFRQLTSPSPARAHLTVGIPVFGPSVRAAALEGSKTFSKDFMDRHAIPTAAYKNFTNADEAKAYVKSCGHDVVIKASGLAAGKGVIIPTTVEEAIAGLDEIMVKREFGAAGDEVVVEEFLTGQEISILAFSDGYTALALPGAQDHKRIGDGDTGPNTGGMGTYSPAPCSTKEVEEEIMRTIVQPTIDGMRRDGE